MTPALSVLLPVYQPQWGYLSSAIHSILQQTFSDFELLVVEAPSVATAENQVRAINDARIRYLSFPGSPSLIDQLNYGLLQSTADLIARMDADDWSYPERFARQLEYLNAHHNVSVLGCQINIMDANDRPVGSRRYPTEPQAVARTLPRYNPLAHPSVMFRKQAVVQAGGYRQFHANEDYELWCRLARQGHQLANLDTTLLRYRLHPGAVKSEKLKKLLRGTRQVKRLYFADTMNTGDRLRYWAEGLLLNLPGPVIMQLFRRLQYRQETMS